MNFMNRTVLAASLLATSLASAQYVLPEANIQRFGFNLGAQNALGAASGDLLPEGALRAYLALNYENGSLVRFDAGKRSGALVGHKLTTHLGVNYGITSWLQLGAEIPLILYQGGDDLSAQGYGAIRAFALGSPFIGARVGILSQGKTALIHDSPLDLAVQLSTLLPLGSPGALAVESSWQFVPSVSAGRRFGTFRLGAELGVIARPAVTLTPSAPVARDVVGPQVDLRLMGSTTEEFMSALRFELSAHTGIPLVGPKTPTAVEVLLGVRAPLGMFELFALLGPGFGSTPGNPTFRVIGGVAFQPSLDMCSAGKAHKPDQCPDLDDDGDGVKNKVDMCALDAEDKDGFEDADGCPDADNDKDGVLDASDECPVVAGVSAYKGCPLKDTDKDGIDDLNDKCPNDPGVAERGGCPIRDADKDGIEDADDRCPSIAGSKEMNGCPDTDKDGIADPSDNCPNEAGPADNQGCPKAKKQLVVITKEKIEIREKVMFATAKSVILPASFGLLDQVASVLQGHPEIGHVQVEGHTDNVGSAETNRKLSQARAEAVVAYLVKKGVVATRLTGKGFGPDKPADVNTTDAGRSNNRRVEFLITQGGETIKTETKTVE